jgi:hypothetical protein
MPSEGVYVGADGDGPREEETIRALKPRQISMIAIGGAIGTGKSHERQRPDTNQRRGGNRLTKQVWLSPVVDLLLGPVPVRYSSLTSLWVLCTSPPPFPEPSLG